ncbi:hypothetical protein [Azospirillum halopraeferens]|uniref:hypothetical protein n=1 Tax=Azospirillum halopraeferens TaxID=34010 RepID=UPI0003F6E639|nr:hypothetical protein [Azospirillum halopraeferens]
MNRTILAGASLLALFAVAACAQDGIGPEATGPAVTACPPGMSDPACRDDDWYGGVGEDGVHTAPSPEGAGTFQGQGTGAGGAGAGGFGPGSLPGPAEGTGPGMTGGT